MGTAVIARRNCSEATISFNNLRPVPTKSPSVDLSQKRTLLAATTVGNYALFGGGSNTLYVPSDVVDAYDSSLTHSTPTALSQARNTLAATTIGSYALFGGGKTSYYTDGEFSVVDAYSASLARSTPTSLSEARENLAATTVGDYSLFAGGDLVSHPSLDKVDVYDDNLVQSTATALSLDRTSLVAATIGEHAIFASGYTYSTDDGSSKGTKNVDAYSSSLVHSTLADVTYYDYDAATAVGDYALFATGYYAQAFNASVDVYNISLVKLTPVNLSNRKSIFTATTLGNFALFGGGQRHTERFSKVEGFDKNLVLHQFEDLSEPKCSLASTTVGNYAFFAGGFNGYPGENTATVDCYEYTSKDLELTLYKGTKYKFQDMDAEATVEADMETKTIATPATGYIKLKKATLS